MFDPTVFDNIKVVVEGDLYELDLDGEIEITNRKDLIDLATMSRTFQMDFTVSSGAYASITLSTNIEQLAKEILGNSNGTPGCLLSVSIHQQYIENNYNEWERSIRFLWGQKWKITHQIIKQLNVQNESLVSKLNYNSLIYESSMEEVSNCLELSYRSLKLIETL